MKISVKNLLRKIAPPCAVDAYRVAFRRYGFFGNYPSWEDAKRASIGYDSDVILNKVRDSLLKVKNGEAIYERDSVLFDRTEYSWPLLAALLWIASRNGNSLNLVDFGGSLGSSYYQNRKFLSHLKHVTWNIVEQKKFVDCGKLYFEDGNVRFYQDIEACLQEQPARTILLSSVIQYLERPYDALSMILRHRFKYVLFDRTPFLLDGDDRITVQKVPPSIYPVSYPSWLLNQGKFLDFFSGGYETIAEFESADKANTSAVFKGFIFKARKNAEGAQ